MNKYLSNETITVLYFVACVAFLDNYGIGGSG